MQRRSRFRHRLIRWLGGTPMTPEVAALSIGPNGELVLPAPDVAKQTFLASRYFSHAEELIRRGAADLAAPYYRQAYTLLHARLVDPTSVDAPTEAQPFSATTVVDLTEANQLKAESQKLPNREVGPRAEPPLPVDGLAAIRTLRSQLSPHSAVAVGEEVLKLRQQGLQHPDLDHLEGLVLLLQGQGSAAAERFRMALALHSGHYGSLVSLSGLVLAQGRTEEAQALLHKALEQVNPDSVEAVPALTNLSLVHQASGRKMDEALLVLKIHRLKPGHLRNERLLSAAEVLEKMAEEPAAIELLQWLSDHEGGEAVWSPLATLLERRGDYQAAALIYRKLLQPKPAEAHGVG